MTNGAPLQTEIEIINPCLDPFSLTMPAQTSPPDYYYTEDAPPLAFATVLFTVDPAVCIVEYSCRILSGPRTDLCAVSDGLTEGFFDTVDGSYTFMSNDV